VGLDLVTVPTADARIMEPIESETVTTLIAAP
jgi:hypothetical protein